MKTCRTCGVEKPVSEFRKHAKRPDGYSTQCKICAREISKKRWREKPEWRSQIYAYNAGRKAMLVEYLRDYLLSHPCVDCGEDDLVVLDFDHVRGVKKENISKMVPKGVSITTLREEIDKCDVRCANCHRRKTAERHGGWWKSL